LDDSAPVEGFSAGLDARYNWWGSSSGPHNDNTNPSGTGDTVSDNVNYLPFLPLSSFSAISFPDSNLEAVIREAINKPVGEIYQTDLLSLKRLDADNKNISNLSGLEYCTSLTIISLDSNQISDISPLAGLTNLTSLYMSENQITNISLLAGLNRLVALYLDSNQIIVISPITGLSNLTRLSFDNNKISDISSITGLTNLMYLNLGYNEISIVAPLAGLTSLTYLALYGNQISDVSSLAGLTSLTDLALLDNQINNISPLVGLINLRMLYLNSNRISDISSLVGNPGLGSGDGVNLSYNLINIDEGSQNRLDIQTLIDRGVNVTYVPQKEPTNINIFTAPIVGASVDVNFTTQPVLLVRDQLGSPMGGVTVTASVGIGTGTLRGTLTRVSDSDGLATFTDLGYNKSGEEFTIHFTANDLSTDSTALGPLSAGAVTKVRVETLSEGTGTVVGAQSLTVGSSLMVYSVTRDQFDNYVNNAACDSWSLSTKTVGVVDGDLVASGDLKNAVITGHLVGTGIIRAVITGLTSTDSGIITVVTGTVDHLEIDTQPTSTLSVDAMFDRYTVVTAYDIGNNPIGEVAIVADRDPATGTGVLRGTLSVNTDENGQSTFSNLGYNKTDEFKVRFTANAKTVISDTVGPLAVGEATQVRVETLSEGTGTVVGAQSLTVGSSLMVYSVTRDQFDNYVNNAACDSWSLSTKTGGVVDGDMVASGDLKSAVITGHLVGTGIIRATISGLTSTGSGIITVVSSGGGNNGGGGGVGGGGGGEDLTVPIRITGLISDPSITLNLKGQVRANVQLSTSDGNCVLKILSATYLMDRYGEVLTEITATINNTPPTAPANSIIVFAYDLGPTGTSFYPYITLIFKYDPEKLPGVNPADLNIACWNGINWDVLRDTVIDTEAHTISVQIWHFSIYALLSPPYVVPTTTTVAPTTTIITTTVTPTLKPTVTPVTQTTTTPAPTTTPITPTITMPSPATFIVSDLAVYPSQVRTGEIVNISTQITHSGEAEGSYSITLMINNLVEDTKVITLSGGQSIAVTFTIRKESAGIYQVNVNGMNGRFTVIENKSLILPFWSWIVIGVALIIIGMVIWSWRWRFKSIKKD
jgi:hypothetical protein